MSVANLAILFVFLSNIVFVIGAAFLLFRILSITEQTRHDLIKATRNTVESGLQLKSIAKTAMGSLDRLNNFHAMRDASQLRQASEMVFRLKNLIEQLQKNGTVGNGNGNGAPGAVSPQEVQAIEDMRAKLQSELNVALSRNHQLQEEIDQTRYQLEEASISNTEMRTEIEEIKDVNVTVMNALRQKTRSLQEQLNQARDRAAAAEALASSNNRSMDQISEQISAQPRFGQAAESAVAEDQSGLIMDQQEQIDMLAQREKELLARIEQMDKAMQRTQAEKGFIEEKFLQLDSTLGDADAGDSKMG